jgi:hypothetical protein
MTTYFRQRRRWLFDWQPASLGLFDALLTLCYIELPRGKSSAATLFARSANRF